jgi:hypothetical protein
MRRRIVSLLLLPLVLANQAMCLAHTHHGTDVAEPDGHCDRPHFHYPRADHGHDQADHRHDTRHSHEPHSRHHHRSDATARPQAVTPVDAHDDNAIYCGDGGTPAVGRGSLKVSPVERLLRTAILPEPAHADNCLPRAGPLRAEPLLAFETGCPIYLRTLSLRI